MGLVLFAAAGVHLGSSRDPAAVPAWPAVAHVGLFETGTCSSRAMGALAVVIAVNRLPLERLPIKILVKVLVLPYTLHSAAWCQHGGRMLTFGKRLRTTKTHILPVARKGLELEGDRAGESTRGRRGHRSSAPLAHACWNVAAIEVKRGAPVRVGGPPGARGWMRARCRARLSHGVWSGLGRTLG